MTTYLVTGATRGLGLELVRQLAAAPTTAQVIATRRAPGSGDALSELAAQHANVAVVALDLADEASAAAAAAAVEAALGGRALDVLVNNAGIAEVSLDGVAAMPNLESSFRTNVLGTHHVTAALLPLLRRGTAKKIINISSTVGSIAIAPYLGRLPTPAYKISKAALNALTVQYALELAPEGFVVAALSPGWIRTELGGGDADLSVQEGAAATLARIEAAGPKDNGHFLNIRIDGWVAKNGGDPYDGSDAPW